MSLLEPVCGRATVASQVSLDGRDPTRSQRHSGFSRASSGVASCGRRRPFRRVAAWRARLLGSVGGIDVERRTQLANEFLGFLPPEDRPRHPTYWSICRAAAGDPSVLQLADRVPPPQLRVPVFLAAVHHVLLGGVDHPLASRYKSVCQLRGQRHRAADDETMARELGDFCSQFADAVARRCETRATQTNEVGRCTVLRAVLGSLAATGVQGVALVDLGCSAGLNLFVDAYGYDVGGHPAGPARAQPLLVSELRGAVPPLGLPRIDARTGVDLSPVDVADPDGVAWLLACLWPDDLARFERLEAAIAVAAARQRDVTIITADMVDGLDEAARLSPGTERLVLVNCWSAAYLPPPRRRELAEAVRALAERRATSWVTMEHPVVARDLGMLPEGAALEHPGASVVSIANLDQGHDAMRVRVVAETHPHGLWLDWRA